MSITHLIFQAKHLINTSTINMIKKTHLLFFLFFKNCSELHFISSSVYFFTVKFSLSLSVN